VFTGLIFGLLPGLQAAGSGLSARIGTAGRATSRAGGRGALVASQAALAVLLLVGAGLLVRSLQALGRVDPGFEPEGLVVADITFPSRWYPERADYLARYDETLEAFEGIPGVVSVGSIRRFPLGFEGEALEWSVPGDPEERPEGRLLQVSPNVFETLGTSFTEGQTFARDAGRDGRLVTVVNRSLAVAAFGSTPAVGRFIDVGLDEPLEIVGVVEDIRHGDLSAPPHPTLYIPQYLSPRRGAAFVLRVAGGPEAAMAAVRDVVRTLDPNQPITELTLATEVVGGQLVRPGFFTLLLAIFAGLALALCAVGVYGVVSFEASRRRREMGIRLAVGAEGRDVVAEVVRGGMVPVALGILLGGAGSAATVRAMESLVYGIGLYDPVAYVGAALVIGLVGLAACYLPARRAAGMSPMEVLATE
jgi:putative ABC transport system permease protein